MVPPDVCDAKQPVLGPSGGPEIDVTVAASPPRVVASGALNIGRSSSEVAHRVRSSIWRLCEHRMVPPDVCDAKQPVLGPSGGPEIDVTVAPVCDIYRYHTGIWSKLDYNLVVLVCGI